MKGKSRTAPRPSRGRTRPPLARECRAPDKLFVVPPEPGQFLAFGRAQGGTDSARVCFLSSFSPVGPGYPVADRPDRRLESASRTGRITPGADRLDPLAPELRPIEGASSP